MAVMMLSRKLDGAQAEAEIQPLCGSSKRVELVIRYDDVTVCMLLDTINEADKLYQRIGNAIQAHRDKQAASDSGVNLADAASTVDRDGGQTPSHLLSSREYAERGPLKAADPFAGQ